MYLRGNLSNAGTITPGSGTTIAVNGTKPQSIDNLATDNLVISGGETKTFTGTISITDESGLKSQKPTSFRGGTTKESTAGSSTKLIY